MKRALILTIVLFALTVAVRNGGNRMDGDPLPLCPPICGQGH